VASDGREFDKRWDGSIYPKRTTISVSQSVRKLCGILRSTGRFDNYDELILDLVRRLIPSEESNVSLHPSEELTRLLREFVAKAEIDCGYRESARRKAMKKHRYRQR
jgi:Arc/MetJ-type ribon-helix-helix transcriptional regulator